MYYKVDIYVYRVICFVILILNLIIIVCNLYFFGGLMYIFVLVKGLVLWGRRNFVFLDLIDCILLNICVCIVFFNGMFLFFCILLYICVYFFL